MQQALTGSTQRVPVDQIELSGRNPRRKLSHLEELAESIRAYGLLQPIVLRPRADGRFEVVAGHRRLAAVGLLGWQHVPAVLRPAADDEAYLLTLVENLQRDDLSPREESSGLEVLVRERGWSTRQVAEAVKRSPGYVSKRLRVFEDPVLAPLVLGGDLTVSAAEELLPLPLRRKRELALAAAEGGWDRAQIRALTRGQGRARRSGSGSNSSRRSSIATRARQLRTMLRDADDETDLSEADRRELRLLFTELAMLARAPADRRDIVVPPIPHVRARAT